MKGAPTGFVFGCHLSGWLQGELFKRNIEHSVEKVKPSEEAAMFVYDGHYFLISNLNNAVLARKKKSGRCVFVSHSTYKFQPLKMSLAGSLKRF
jgi:hypothetical protein